MKLNCHTGNTPWLGRSASSEDTMAHMEPTTADAALGTHPGPFVTSGKSGAGWTAPQPDTSALPVPSADDVRLGSRMLTELCGPLLEDPQRRLWLASTIDPEPLDHWYAMADLMGPTFADEWWELGAHDSEVV